MNDIITAISTVGFPIVMCILQLYINDKQDTRNDKTVNSLGDVINNNTIAITKLYEKLSASDGRSDKND